MLREEGLRTQEDENQGDGTIEDRVIRSSLAMIAKSGKKKNSDLTLQLFAGFAVFPEDIPVPLEVITVLTEIMTGNKESPKMQLRQSCEFMAYQVKFCSTSSPKAAYLRSNLIETSSSQGVGLNRPVPA